MKISAILLAAGLSTRMINSKTGKKTDKLQIIYNGKTLFQHACELLENLPVYERIIITKQENPDRENGISTSIIAGVKRATGTHYLFLAADQPRLQTVDITELIEAAKSNPEKIIYPKINNKPSNPVIFPAKFREELLTLKGDTGGRVIRDKCPEQCMSIIPKHPERFYDIDSEADL